MPQSRGYSSGTFAVELQGKAAGFVRSVEGGEAFGTVVTSPAGVDGIVKKEIGRVDFEPITITFGVGMAPELYAWIAEMVERRQTPRDGAICFLNYNFTEVERLEWKNGVITEVVFPAADGSSKDAAVMAVTITAESTALSSSGGKAKSGFSTKAKKQWMASNFRFSVSGLEAASSKVRKVSSFRITQAVKSAEAVGAERLAERQLGTVEVSNLGVTVALASAKPWLDWVNDVLVKGNTGDEAERTATLEYLDQTGKNVVFTINLDHVGPVRVERQMSSDKLDVVADVQLELYVESATFEIEADSAGDVVNAQPSAEAPIPPASEPAPRSASAANDLRGGILTDAESVGEVERALRVLRAAPQTRKPELVAARLKATTARAAPAVTQRPQRTEGESLGERWASEQASLLELQQIGELEGGEWSGIRLAEDHSLVAQLQKAGVIPPGGEGPLQLIRDDFVEGVVAGAARVFRAVQTHLKE
jgi:hypothetical protein